MLHTRTHTHTFTNGGVEVWPATTHGREQPVCSPGAYLSLHSTNVPRTFELCTAAHLRLGWLLSHREGGKVRERLIRVFMVLVLQVAWMDEHVDRLIGAATTPGTQPA